MIHLELAQHIDVPIDDLFNIVIDFERYPEWSGIFTKVKEIRGASDEVGTQIIGTCSLLDHEIEGVTEITDVDRPYQVKLSGAGPHGCYMQIDYRFTRVGPATDLRVDINLEPPSTIVTLFDKIVIERSIGRELRASLDSLKALAEVASPARA